MKLLTKDTLDRANAINNRLCKVKAWLAGLDETDPSGIDEQSRYSPIILSCGMAKTLDVVKQDVTELKEAADDLDETTDNLDGDIDDMNLRISDLESSRNHYENILEHRRYDRWH